MKSSFEARIYHHPRTTTKNYHSLEILAGALMDWNLLAVSYEREELRLLEELKNLGEFKTTDFRSLLLGKVNDLNKFLDELNRRMPLALSRVIPLEETFYTSPETLVETLKRRVERYADRINPGETFCVRFERRGFKGVISSQAVEREVGGHLYQLLERQGKKPKVSLEDPDKLITIQTLGNLCGMGLIDRELRRRCSFVRAK